MALRASIARDVSPTTARNQIIRMQEQMDQQMEQMEKEYRRKES